MLIPGLKPPIFLCIKCNRPYDPLVCAVPGKVLPNKCGNCIFQSILKLAWRKRNAGDEAQSEA